MTTQTRQLMASELIKILVDRLAHDGDFEIREPVKWAIPDVVPNPVLEATKRYFEEVGTVSKDEYEAKLEEIRAAYHYLEQEQCYRVEYNRGFGQVPKVDWVEDVDADSAALNARNAAESFNRLRMPNRTPVLLVSLRRATVEDLDEFLEET